MSSRAAQAAGLVALGFALGYSAATIRHAVHQAAAELRAHVTLNPKPVKVQAIASGRFLRFEVSTNGTNWEPMPPYFFGHETNH